MHLFSFEGLYVADLKCGTNEYRPVKCGIRDGEFNDLIPHSAFHTPHLEGPIAQLVRAHA